MLLLLAVQIQDGAINVVEELGVVFDRVAAAEKHNDLLLLGLHSPQEGEEQDKSLVSVAQNVSLFKTIHSAVLLLLVDVDV